MGLRSHIIDQLLETWKKTKNLVWCYIRERQWQNI